MPIFKVQKNKLDPIRESKIDLESDIQSLTEQNLDQVFGLGFISSEFTVGNLRLDTVAFDEESKSFVIIEYKRDRSFSVVDQGFAYLSVMLNNKADFVLEFNEKSNKNLKRGDVDWSQSRVVFIANSFTPHQQKAIEFKDLPIELWEVKKYDNQTILYNQLKAAETAESINTVTKDESTKKVSRQVKKYTIEDHFKSGWEASRDLFDALRDKILELDQRFVETPRKLYIAYSINGKNVVSLHPYQSKIIVTLSRTKPEDLNDPGKIGILRKKSMEYYNQYLTDIEVKDKVDIAKTMLLIEQVLGKYK